ncbi:hypothetical protein [Novosphingobium sp.]|uniref:hypothetical protein n=1 Tax=Novosphingobium sp. TaxID=1874826 RepID=UPI003BAA2B2E
MVEWLRRLDRFSNLPPAERILIEHPDDWMRRSSYRLIRNLIRREQEHTLAPLVAKLEGEHRRGRGVAGQPFKQGLLVMQILVQLPAITAPAMTRSGPSESADRRFIADAKRRNELGDAMQYAHLHNVPSKYFNAFIRHAGTKRIRAMLKHDRREPGFKLKV